MCSVYRKHQVRNIAFPCSVSCLLGPTAMMKASKEKQQVIWSGKRGPTHIECFEIYNNQLGIWQVKSSIHQLCYHKKQGEIDASNKKAFITHLSSNPNGILDGVQHNILTLRSQYSFSEAENTSFCRLGSAPFPEDFIAWNGYSIARNVISMIMKFKKSKRNRSIQLSLELSGYLKRVQNVSGGTLAVD